jgi:hypothetical protein
MATQVTGLSISIKADERGRVLTSSTKLRLRKLFAIAWAPPVLACLLIGLGLVTSASAGPMAPADIVDGSRNVPPTNDFLRLLFIPSTADNPTTLGRPHSPTRPDSYRVFFGDTEFYQPPIQLTTILGYSGIPYVAGQDLIALRCMPPNSTLAEPMLATWPNVFKAMKEDYAAHPPTTPYDTALLNIANQFQEVQSIAASITLANALDIGSQVFSDADSPGCTTNSSVNCPQTYTMTNHFGTFPAFSGLGYAIKNTQASPILNSALTLTWAVVPEYILRNVTLSDAGCRCIRVTDYPGRQTARFNPQQVLREGPFGACKTVGRL